MLASLKSVKIILVYLTTGGGALRAIGDLPRYAIVIVQCNYNNNMPISKAP